MPKPFGNDRRQSRLIIFLRLPIDKLGNEILPLVKDVTNRTEKFTIYPTRIQRYDERGRGYGIGVGLSLEAGPIHFHMPTDGWQAHDYRIEDPNVASIRFAFLQGWGKNGSKILHGTDVNKHKQYVISNRLDEEQIEEQWSKVKKEFVDSCADTATNLNLWLTHQRKPWELKYTFNFLPKTSQNPTRRLLTEERLAWLEATRPSCYVPAK